MSEENKSTAKTDDAEAKAKAAEEAKAKAEAEAKAKAEQKVDVKILRDFWDAKGIRHREGTIVSVPVEAALDGIESGALALKLGLISAC